MHPNSKKRIGSFVFILGLVASILVILMLINSGGGGWGLYVFLGFFLIMTFVGSSIKKSSRQMSALLELILVKNILSLKKLADLTVNGNLDMTRSLIKMLIDNGELSGYSLDTGAGMLINNGSRTEDASSHQELPPIPPQPGRDASVCPACGARTKLTPGKDFVFCEYCGTKIDLRRAG